LFERKKSLMKNLFALLVACCMAVVAMPANASIDRPSGHSDPWIRFVDDDYSPYWSNGDRVVATAAEFDTVDIYLPQCDEEGDEHDYDSVEVVARGLGTVRVVPFGFETIDGLNEPVSIGPTNTVVHVMCLDPNGEDDASWTIFIGS
jgi:hypothetical protein